MQSSMSFLILCYLFFTSTVRSAPIDYNYMNLVPIRVIRPNERFVWNVVGDLVSGSGVFPLEVNVPDTVGSIYGGLMSLVQRIPWISRLTSPERPRPLRLHVLVNERGEILAATSDI